MKISDDAFVAGDVMYLALLTAITFMPENIKTLNMEKWMKAQIIE